MGRHQGNCYEGFDNYAIKLIRHKARRLVGTAGLRSDDVPDIEQDLAADLLRRLGRFDERRAKRETFISRVVDHAIATMLEARKAGVRDYRKEAEPIDDEWIGESAQVDEFLCALRIDLERLVSALPPHQREICERLRTATVSEISQETGVPRGSIYEEIGRIRKRFEKAGLSAYLSSPDRLSRAPVGKERERTSSARREPRRRG